jgi:type I restriction enzyme S subunit
MKVKLKDVVIRINNNIDRFNTDIKYYLGKGHGECGEIAITERGDLKADVGILGFKFHFAFQPKDTLFFSRSFALRKAGMAMYEGLCSDSTYILRTKDESILLPTYLPAVLQSESFWEYCDTNHTGGVNFLINWSTLADYEFELPSIEEQRVLAEKLWAAYELKEAYKKMIAATDEMVKSQFIEMFGKMGTTPIKEYVLDSYPGEWGVEDTDGNGVRVIRTTNFTNTGKLNLADVVRRNIEEKKVSRKRILKYDTILERSGGTNDNPVGRVVLFEEDGLFLCNNFTQVLRFKDIDPRFAFYALFYFYQTNRTAIRSMGSKTTGIQNLNMSKYLEIGIPNATTEQQYAFMQIAEQADKSKFVD